MCDTLVALAPATATGRALFAKNSDRERNEAQVLEMVPARTHRADAAVRLTYVSIPQAAHTHACLLSRPFWMWGAEMGANEHGVSIGNEALHAKLPASRRRALIGMDLVRLGLERGASAAEATAVIIELLERHGQGGDCGHLGRFYYQNGFIIADAREAFVLETAGRWWAVARVVRTRALSNAYSIGDDYERISPDFPAYAAAQGWCDKARRVDFAAALIDDARDAVSFGRGRCARGTTLLQRNDAALTPNTMMAILRDHDEEGARADWTPADTVRRSICMHAAAGPRRSQTTGSIVSTLEGPESVHWVTGSAAPCLSVFKPVTFASGLPDQGPTPTDRYAPGARWWRHERLHRAVNADYAHLAPALRAERDALERDFLVRVESARAQGAPAALRAVVAACWREADAAEARWMAALALPRGTRASAYHRSWARLNALAGVPATRANAGGRADGEQISPSRARRRADARPGAARAAAGAPAAPTKSRAPTRRGPGRTKQ